LRANLEGGGGREVTDRGVSGGLVVSGARLLATAQGGAAPGRGGAGRVSLVEGGAVVSRGGLLTWVGPESDLPADARGLDRLDAVGGTIVPGFVDAHSHAVFGGDRTADFRRRLAGATYLEIAAAGGGIASTVAATRASSTDALREGAARRLRELLRHGATTVEVKSGYGLDVDTELRMLEAARLAGQDVGIEVVPTYLGAHVVPREHAGRRERYLDLVIEEALPAVAERGLAEFCDAWCDAGAFTADECRRVLLRARELGLRLKVHADQLAPSGGAELAAEVGATSAEHLLHASDAGVAAMSARGVVAVLLPSSALFLGERPPDAARWLDAGCAVAIASDLNPGSCPSANLALVAALACLTCGLDPDETLAALTLGGAAALARADRIGTIEPGKRCDLVVLDAPSPAHLPYRLGTNIVRHVVASGRCLVRDGRVESPTRP
jgi:imidazolonepropionase